MLVSIKKRFIFVANSKTGSTTIEAALRPHAEFVGGGSPEAKHASWLVVESSLNSLFRRPEFAPELFFRFGVMREPADWVLSWYNYRRFNKNGGISADMGFEAFWRTDDWVKRKRQSAHFLAKDGNCCFDLIIPMPHLTGALPQLFSAMGVDAAGEKVRNKSSGTLARSEIDPELWREINEHYDADLKIYQEWMERFPAEFTSVLDRFYGKESFPLPAAPESVFAEFSQTALVLRRRPHVLSEFVVTKEACLDCVWLKLSIAGQEQESGFTLKGALLFNGSLDSNGLRLVLERPSGSTEIQWGLPSPKVAERFPDHPSSRACRFRLPNLSFGGDESATIWLVDERGQRQRIASLVRKPPVV